MAALLERVLTLFSRTLRDFHRSAKVCPLLSYDNNKIGSAFLFFFFNKVQKPHRARKCAFFRIILGNAFCDSDVCINNIRITRIVIFKVIYVAPGTFLFFFTFGHATALHFISTYTENHRMRYRSVNRGLSELIFHPEIINILYLYNYS